MTRLTLEWNNNAPAWTPDGGRVLFTSARGGRPTLLWQSMDGRSEAEQLVKYGSDATLLPVGTSVASGGSWAPDGRVFAYTAQNPRTGSDISLLPMDGIRQPRPFLETSFDEALPAFSRDGHWLAYVSNETGRSEVYVQPYPGPGRKWRISTEGGTRPVWARNGQELFYRTSDAMMSVRIVTSPSFSPGVPQILFRSHSAYAYDVATDGRFLMIEDNELSPSTAQVEVAVGWFEELKRRVPTR